MNAEQRLERLAERAREDRPASLDVTHRVMRRIADRPSPGSAILQAERTVLLCAGASVLAAGIMLVLSLPFLADLDDPINELLQAMNMVMQ